MPSPDPSPSFTWNAADYHKSSPARHHWAQELIAKPGLSGTSRVLDIGCGEGKITAEIARDLPEGSVTGMDSSPPPSSPSDDHRCNPLQNPPIYLCISGLLLKH